ncbi:uncharacterized protein LOC132728544 [Ruditapes philippinarum]|uniref:uncharacterized protein LOC132728544 n=1 Tax=Ruditapes philippinarum TaxID=129788 RepID=UPI00295BC22D|nr:uncharacterized protein LOC132728544 [Ruditapes philippinarum]
MAEINTKLRKRKVSIIHESSSSCDEVTPLKKVNDDMDQTNTPRSSERLQKKRSRTFRKPSREDVWKKITPTKSPEKYEQLRPKRLVNNFTKENNSYNYDPNETSGDESMNDFLDDSLTEQSSSDSSRETLKHKKQVRIKGRRRRLQMKSEVNESSSTDSDGDDVTDVMNTVGADVTDKNEDPLSGDSAICVRSTERGIRNNVTDSSENDDTDEDLEIVARAKTRKLNRSVIESDDNDIDICENKEDRGREKIKQGCKRLINESDDGNDSDENIAVTKKHNRSIIESDEDECIDGNAESLEHCRNKSEESPGNNNEPVVDKENKDDVTECNGHSNVPKNDKSKKEFTNFEKVTATEIQNDSENVPSSCDSESDSEGTSADTSEASDNESDEDLSNSSRVRVQMLKKKNDRKKLFDKFREERQRRLSKEH